MRPASAALALLLAACVLAGCAEGPGAEAASDPLASGVPALQATDTTGVLRGVVVDEAIRPLANATVALTGPSGPRTAVTGPDGFFGFAALEPGGYFVSVSRLAYVDTQAAVDVVAGVSEPPMVRVQLAFVPSEAPFVTSVHRTAFVQCIVPGANLCAIVNLYPCAVAGYCQPLVQDTSYVLLYDELMAAGRAPDWYQTEMLWESTQSLSPDLAILASPHEPADGAGRDERQAAVAGPSPLLLALNGTAGTEWDLGTGKGVSYEIFGHMQATSAIGSLGVVLNQQVDFYFNAFYRYVPPGGWSIAQDGFVPPPPQ